MIENIRQKFWTEVYLAYIRGSEQPFASLAALRADEALRAFDERFNAKRCDNAYDSTPIKGHFP